MSQDIITEIRKRNPPGPLYHYTTQSGLQGIIENKCIWATHTQYLNDQSEYTHAVKIILEVINDCIADSTFEPIHASLVDIKEGLHDIEFDNVCVCSFSENGDSLSQWRAYGGPTSGYSIGLDYMFMHKVVNHSHLKLWPCLYDKDEQIKLIHQIISQELQDVQNMNKFGTALSRAFILSSITHYAPMFKDPAFKDEKEWRIMTDVVNVKDLFFREGKSMLIPYTEIPLLGDQDEMSVNEVVIGPTPHIRQSHLSVESLLNREGIYKAQGGATDITDTKVPYRSW